MPMAPAASTTRRGRTTTLRDVGRKPASSPTAWTAAMRRPDFSSRTTRARAYTLAPAFTASSR